MSPQNPSTTSDRWLPHAAAFREHIGSPLRPIDQDIQLFSSLVHTYQQTKPNPPRALILGVTPELHELPWRDRSQVFAIDQSAAMIQDVWPGLPENATHANWLQMPFADHSLDIVLCDGGLHLLAFPEQQARLAAHISRVLVTDGLCCFRLFVPPAAREHPADVLTDLHAGRIENMNCLKLKLGMSMQTDAATGVRLGDVWQRLDPENIDVAAIVRGAGWTAENFNTIAAYKDSDTRYHFSDLAQVIAMFESASQGRLTLASVMTPTYTLGDQCPIVTFRAGAR